jgi:hypothetical protein
MAKADVRRMAFKPTGELLLPGLRRHVMRDSMRVDPDRDMSFIHPSEMVKADWCHTRAYWRISGAEPAKAKQIDFRLANVFAEGHAIHHRYQTWLWDMGVLWGRWQCKACDDSFFALSPMFCHCGGDLKYREVPLFSAEHHVIGHADGAVWLPEWEKPRLIEIKSVGIGTVRFEAPSLHGRFQDGEITLDQLWYSINRPFGSHLKQGNLYLALAPSTHEYLVEVDQIIFIYEWKPTQDVKEFTVSARSEVVSELLEDARSVRVSLERATPPERPYWADAAGPICKACPYKAHCWGTEPPKEAPDGPVTTNTTAVRRSSAAKRRKVLGKT